MNIDRIPVDKLGVMAEFVIAEIQADPSQYVMALVDHLFLYEQSDIFSRWPGEKPSVFNLYDHLSGGEERISPLLIPLPSAPDDQLSVILYLLKRCNTYPMLSIMTSTLEPQEIAPHLASLTSILLPPDLAPSLLRFADTRVVPTLHRLLDPTQRSQLFGLFDCWAYIKGNCLADIPLSDPMRLSDAQFEALLQSSEPDNFILTLRENSAAFSELPPSVQYRQVCHWIDTANEAASGEIQPGERFAYCLTRLPSL